MTNRERPLTEYERQWERGIPAPFLTRRSYPLDKYDRENLERRRKLRAEWDEKYAEDGEGPAFPEGVFRWVRITDDRGKVLGTFFVRSFNGQAQELFVSTPQKGFPPNPYVSSPISLIRWPGYDGMMDAIELGLDPYRHSHRNPDKPLDPRPYNHYYGVQSWDAVGHEWQYSLSGLWDAFHNPGQRPVTGVIPLQTNDGDTQFKFVDGEDGFIVRGSKLAPALLAVLETGNRKVTLHALKLVIAGMRKRE